MESVDFRGRHFIKTVLTRIISIVRVPSLFSNRDNTFSHDDEVKHTSLSVKRSEDLVLALGFH